MTTLAKDTPRGYELGEQENYPVIAADIIYEGAAVGDNGSGYARPLAAGDPFLGFCTMNSDNSLGAAGDIRVRVKSEGAVLLTFGSVAITDVGKDVFASDDNTFTLTATSNSRIGRVRRYVSSTTAVVEFEAVHSRMTALTDSTGASATTTLSDVTGSHSQSVLNVNFATLAKAVNLLIQRGQ